MKRVFNAIAILLLSLVVVAAISIVFYMQTEGWPLIDAFYFTITVITSLGHPDLIPSTSLSKIFTSFLAFIGIGIVLTIFSLSSSLFIEKYGIRK